MRDDIYGGLRNAMSKGSTLEQAVRSFINAGYSEAEVMEVAKIFTDGALSVTSQATPPAQTSKEVPAVPVVKVPQAIVTVPGSAQPQIRPPQTPQQYSQPLQQPRPQILTLPNHKSHSGSLKIIILVLLLLVLLGTLAGTLLYKDVITNYLSGVFG